MRSTRAQRGRYAETIGRTTGSEAVWPNGLRSEARAQAQGIELSGQLAALVSRGAALDDGTSFLVTEFTTDYSIGPQRRRLHSSQAAPYRYGSLAAVDR